MGQWDSTHPANQKDLQSHVLDPLQRGLVPLVLLNILYESGFARVHRFLNGVGTLAAYIDIFADIEESPCLQKCTG